MKKLKYVLMIISICLIVAVLYGNIHTYKSTGDFFAGNVEMPELEWSAESVSEPKVVAKLVTRADDEETYRTIQNHTAAVALGSVSGMGGWRDGL